MKSKFIKRQNSPRLIIIFAGWSMDWRPFAGLDHPGYDLMVVWDYRDLSFNWKPFFKYEEICLFAWSMGVFAASVTVHEIAPRVTMRIAINGTLHPIDEHRGIPPAIWSGTLNSLSPATLRKFQRRMCTSAAQYADFAENAPKRPFSEVQEELVALETHTIFHVEQMSDWDMAIVGQHDAIFPFANQIEAWKGLAPVRVFDGGHLPDFFQLINRLVIDKPLVGGKFGKATDTYGNNAEVQKDVTHRLMDCFNRNFGYEDIVGNVIEIGPGADGFLTRQWYRRTDRRAKILLWDLNDVDVDKIAPGSVFEKCDAEMRIRKQPSDSAGFIFSSSTVQWFNSPKSFLSECARVLVPGGWLVLSSFAPGHFAELASVTGNGLQLNTMADWKKMIPAGMDLLVCETDDITLTFDSPRQVLEHLRSTGVNSVRFGESPMVTARRILDNYPCNPESGKYELTYRPIFIVACKNETAS